MSFMVVERSIAGVMDSALHGHTCICGECPLPLHVVHRMHGGGYPTVFRTLRNAVKAAGQHIWGGLRDGFVVKFDPSLLPIVEETLDVAKQVPMHAPPTVPRRTVLHGIPVWDSDPDDPDTLDAEFALAERQMLAWAARADRLRAQMATMTVAPEPQKKRRRTRTTT